jgi:hypothetical protein
MHVYVHREETDTCMCMYTGDTYMHVYVHCKYM